MQFKTCFIACNSSR